MTQELADRDDSLHKQGSSETVQHDPESQSCHDTQYTLEESDLFPVSRASSCTVVSEQEKRVLSPAASTDRETPVVKPHPFSFRTTPHSTTGSSTDSFHRHHASSESECYDRQSDTASIRAIRSKSNSLNYSGEYPYSTSVPSGSLKNSPLVSTKQQQRSHMTTDSTITSATNTLCTCDCRDHPVASKDEVFGYRQFRCKCHFGDPRSCAFDPATESMGFCPINQGFIKFDPHRRYSDDKLNNLGLIVTNTPPSRNSSNVSLSSNFSQSPHNTQLPSMSPPYHCNRGLPSRGPYSQSPKDAYESNNAIRTSCTSIDSGYEKSMSVSSFTSSAREPSSLGSGVCQPQYGSTGDVSMTTPSGSCAEPHGDDDVLTKPRARSLCEMERKENRTNSPTTNLLNQGIKSLYPKLPLVHVAPQVIIDDCTLTNQQALEAKLTTSVTSTCSSDTATPVGPLSKSATPSPTNSIGNNSATSTMSKADLRRAYFANKGKKAKGIRTIEDSQLKQQQNSSTLTRPRSQAISYTADNKWKTKSCEAQMTTDTITSTNDNHVTSTPTFFGNRTLGSNSLQQPNQVWNGCTSSHCPMDFECPPNSRTATCVPPQQTCYSFGINPSATRFELFNSRYHPTFGSPNVSSLGSASNSKSGTHASASMAVAAAPTLILPSDVQSVISETDSGHCTKSIDDRSQADVDVCSQASELSNLDNTSEYSEVDNDVFGVRQRAQGSSQRNQWNHQYQKDQYSTSDSVNPESSLNALHLRQLQNSPSLLQQKLREYEAAMYSGGRPRMLEQFEDFTDVELPIFDEFCLDESPSEMAPSHRHRMGDFGHSLFAG